MYVCMYVCTYVRTYICMYVFLFAHTHMYICVCIYIYMQIHIHSKAPPRLSVPATSFTKILGSCIMLGHASSRCFLYLAAAKPTAAEPPNGSLSLVPSVLANSHTRFEAHD